MGECYSERVLNNFNSKFVTGKPDECWYWKGSTDRDGYGRYNGKTAHRMALHIKTGRMGKGIKGKALHTCDNPTCVNPNHLDWGTQKKNMTDKALRGRAAINRGTKLCWDTVAFMREIYENNQMTLQELAETFDISYNQTRRIVGGYDWVV